MFERANMNKGRHKYFRDIYLLVSILFISAIIFFLQMFFSSVGNTVECSYLTSEGRQSDYFSLNKEGYYLIYFDGSDIVQDIVFYKNIEEIKINDQVEYNLICIKNGCVDCAYASCPDKICVNSKSIKHNNENICCLPHQLFLTVVNIGEDNMETPDAISW